MLKNMHWRKWNTIILFALVLLVNALSGIDVIFPMTIAEVSAKYVNMLAPPGITFSIWGLIYLGVTASLTSKVHAGTNQRYRMTFQEKIDPLFIVWMILNMLWITAWGHGKILAAFIFILLYALTMAGIIIRIQQYPELKQQNWLLVYPAGLHFGWLIVAPFANLTAWLVALGMDGIGFVSVMWTVVAAVIILAIATYFAFRYQNVAILWPSLWTLIGLMVKHGPNSSFVAPNFFLFLISLLLFIVGLGFVVQYFRKYRLFNR